MKKKSLSVLIALTLATTTLVPTTGVFAATTTTAPASTYAVEYEGHVQNIGWQAPVTVTGDQADITTVGEAGTNGKSLRVEALKIAGVNLPAGASITYQAHVQNVGWQAPVTSDSTTTIDTAKVAGTSGKSLRVEALKLTLNGLPGYAIKYQGHVQNVGWQAPVVVENGTAIDTAAIAGTTGQSLRVEALKIEIVKTDAEKAAEVAAIDAVTKAETSKSTADITAATTAVQAVKDTTEATALTTRISAITAKLEVASVTSINGNQLKVTFTQAVDSTTAQNASNYSLAGGSNSVSSAKIQSDNKSVILNLASTVANTTSATYGITISGVASAVDTTVTIPVYTGLVTVADTIAPDVASITSSTNGSTATTATVTFTKPLPSAPAVKIDGAVVSAVSTTTDTTTGVTVLNLSALSLDATTTHTLQVINATDAEGNVNALITKTFSVTKDTTAPVISSVAAYGDHQILVTFSKKMASLNAANFAVLDENLGDLTGESISALTGDTTGTKYLVGFTTTGLYSSKTTRNLTLLVKPIDSTSTYYVEDSLGNELAANSQSAVALTKDVTKPTVVGVTVQKTAGVVSSITVQYSEPVTETGTIGDLQFYNSNGALVAGTTGAGTVSISDSTKVVYAPGTTTTFTGTYSVVIPVNEVADTALVPNNSGSYTGSVDFGTASTSSSWTLSSASVDATTTKGTISVTFPNAVKGGSAVGSATNPSNYTLNGTTLPIGTSITFTDTTQTVAKIVLPTGFVSADDTAAVFTINNVQRLSDSLPIAAFTKAINAYDSTAPVLQSAKIIDDTHIILTYNENITNPAGDAAADFTIKANGSTVTEATLNAATVSGFNKEIELTLATPLSTTQLGQTITVSTASSPTVVKDASTLTNVQAGSVTVTATK